MNNKSFKSYSSKKDVKENIVNPSYYDPNTSKRKIEASKFTNINDKPKNVIKAPKVEHFSTSKNKINSPHLDSKPESLNRIESPTMAIISPIKNETQLPQTQESIDVVKKSSTYSSQKSWKFMNYDQNGKTFSREQKLKVAEKYFNSKILPKLKLDTKIKEKLKSGKGIGVRDLNTHGFSMFYHSLTNYGIKVKWNEFKAFVGYKISIDQDKYRFLNFNKDGNRLTKQEKMSIAKKHFKNTILHDLAKIPEIKEKLSMGKPPTYADLHRYGHSGFIGPLSQKKPKIRYNELLRSFDFRPNVIRGKYKFLNYDKNGNLLSSREKLNIAVKQLKGHIIPTLLEKGKYKESQPITRKLLDQHGFQHFTHAFANEGPKINFNALLTKAGYEINIDHKKWVFLKYNKNGKILSVKEKLEKAVDYFQNKIYPGLVQKGVVIKGEAPTTLDLIKNEFTDYLNAIIQKKPKISFNQVIKKAGFEPKSSQDHDKWKIFYDENMKPFSRDGILKVAAKYFKESVIPDLIKKKAIVKGQNPSVHILKKYGHYDFFKAIGRRGLNYNEILVEVGYDPNFANKMSEIGVNFHWNAERIFLEHTRNLKCNSFYEVKGNADNSIIVNENFKQLSLLSNTFTQKHPEIKIINFDYYLSAAKEKVLEHGVRGYQGEDKALILVPINAKKPQKIEYDLPFSSNILVLNPKTFINFMGYKSKIREEFIEIIELARKAPFTQICEQLLRQKALKSVKSIKLVKNDLNYSTNEYRIYIKEKKD
ncbi:MAG: hypothetical protein ACFFBH_04965 [Promethearchaeota archaeon]